MLAIMGSDLQLKRKRSTEAIMVTMVTQVVELST